MSNTYLQEPLDAHRLCAAEWQTDLVLPLRQLERGRDLLVSDEGELSFRLQFSYGEQRQMQVTGHLRGTVYLCCQRCLEAVREELDKQFHWGLVSSDEAAVQLPRSLEPVLLTAGRLMLQPALEDEVLLALPLVARHALGNCPQLLPGVVSTPETDLTEQKPNPFSLLQEIKGKLKN